MMRLDDIVQFYPSRVTITPQRSNKGASRLVDAYARKLFKERHKEQYQTNFKIKAKDYNLSKASKRKIFDSINTMYCLSKPRNIQMQNGKTLYNFRLSFITLTLPSMQNHSDTDIKSLCINQFLFEIKRKYGIQNFVWKAELQKNENIHFHLILDHYIDFQALRRRWNRIINKLGYVDAYQQKFSSLSLLEYNQLTNPNNKTDFSIIKERFASGKKSNWSNPNSVDVRQVMAKRDLAVYLGKYFAKPSTSKKPIYNAKQKDISNNITALRKFYCTASETEKPAIKNQIELLERLESFGRIWSRSYTLAQLKFVHKYLVSEIQDIIRYLDEEKTKVKKVVGDFFTVFYFNASELHKNFTQFHSFYLYSIAKIFNYPIPAT